MTPPAAATAAGRTATPPAPRVPRRVSGPARQRPRPVAAPPVGLRVADRVRALPDAPFLDRLIHGRAWIGIVAVALLGIVFMQVSLLKLNAGIGADVKKVQTLERANAELRAQVSRLASGSRIQEFANGLGLVMPPADGFRYVTAGRIGDAERAARSIRPPVAVEQQVAGQTGVAAQAAATETTAPATLQGAAPAATETQATAPAGAAPAQSTTTASAGPPATTSSPPPAGQP